LKTAKSSIIEKGSKIGKKAGKKAGEKILAFSPLLFLGWEYYCTGSLF